MPNPPILEYAGPHRDAPFQTKFQCIYLEGGGVRFVQPASGWTAVHGNIGLALLGLGIVIVLSIVTAMTWREFTPHDLLARTLILVCTAAFSYGLWYEGKLRATHSLFIQAANRELIIDRPQLFARYYRWQVEELSDIRAGMSTPSINIGAPMRMVSSLVIAPRLRLPLRLLEHSDVAEIKWIVRELRRALELPEIV